MYFLSAMFFRRCCGYCCRCSVAIYICESGRGTDSAGVGAVELPTMPRQRVVNKKVDAGWIEKYFSQRRHSLRPNIVGPIVGFFR